MEFALGRWRNIPPEQTIRHLELARKIFPLEHWFRSSLADFYSEVRWAGSIWPGIDAIRDELEVDPYNAGLRRNLAGLLLEACDEAGAKRELDIVRMLVPTGAIPVFVNVNPAKVTPVRCRDGVRE